ncbi:gastrokine-3-like [Rhynchocyon petersi]
MPVYKDLFICYVCFGNKQAVSGSWSTATEFFIMTVFEKSRTIKSKIGHRKIYSECSFMRSEPDNMKCLIVSFTVMIFLLNPSMTLMNTSNNQLLVDSFGTQIIHVDAFRRMVSIRDNNVLSEWDGIMDYKNGFLAAKIFDKMACVLANIDQAAFPTLDEIMKALNQQDLEQYPSTHGLTYTVLPSRVKNLAQYGVGIEDMCRAVPTYFARQQKEGVAIATDPDSCSEIQLLSFMGLTICGEIPGL